MPWFIPWSDVIKKKVCRYLLQRYLGQFLDEKLSLEQLNVDLYNGTGTVSNIALYSKSLNDLCESQKWPVEVVEGHLGSVTVNVPWNALMSEDGNIEISNLYLAIKPRPIEQTTDGKSVLESMFSSMSSSMQLAQDCMERERLTPANLQATAMEGLEKFAMTIDNVLNRIKAKLFNTELRIEYILPDDSNRGLAIIIKVGHISYENEAGKELKAEDETPTTASQLDKDFDEESVARGSNNKEQQQQSNKRDEKEVYYLSAYAIHHITLTDIAIYTEEFTVVDQQHESQQRQKYSSESGDDQQQNAHHHHHHQLLLQDSVMSEQFYSTISEFPIPELQQSVIEDPETTSSEDEAEPGGGGGGHHMKIYSSGELQIAALNGLHEIRLSMKQSESVVGANVELEVNLGVLELLLSPRQVHMISVILESFSPPPSPASFASPEADKKMSSDATKSRQKSVNEEQEYSAATAYRSQFNHMSGGFSYAQQEDNQSHHHHRQLSPQRMDEWRRGSELRSQLGADSLMTSSSTMSSSMSSASTMVNSTRSRRTVTMNQDYDSVLISTYVCRIGGLVAVLLHDDILMDTQAMSAMCYGPPLTEVSCQQMQVLSGAYFSELKKLNLVAELRQLPVVEQQHLDKLVTQYHLRLLLATIILEGEERRNPKENLLQFNGSVVKVRLTESLGGVKVPLLDFVASPGDLTRVPHVQVMHQSLQRVHLLHGIEYLSEPVVKCRVNIATCLSELDISIYDRLKVLSESYPFQLTRVDRHHHEPKQETKLRRRRKQTPAFSLAVQFDRFDIHLRFPVADLRPVHDPQRVPWWERNVRSDYMVLRLVKGRVANVKTDIFSIEADELLLFFVENEAAPVLIPLGTCVGRVAADTQAQHLPSIIIDMSEVVVGEEGSQKSGGVSGPPPSPFARSKMCRESDTPHRKGPGTAFSNHTEDSEVLVMPGNREELRAFTEFSLKHSRTRLTIHLPRANLQLKSKHIYELIYNRINSDLLLWTPGSHQQVVAPGNNSGGAGDLLFNVGLMDSVYAPSVSHEIDDSDDDEEEDDDDDGEDHEDDTRYGGSDGPDSDLSDEIYTFKSFKQRRQQSRRRRRKRRNRSKAAAAALSLDGKTNECDFAFCLQVDELSVAMYPPARNANNQVIPEQHGEFQMRAQCLKLVSVKGFCGNENLGYVCLDADGLSVSHCGLAPLHKKGDSKSGATDHLLKTIYPTPEKLTLNGLPDHQSSRKMLSLALQIRLCPEQEMKRLRLAAVVHTATLKHNNPSLAEQSWLMELMDMFDVLDYPIPGYKACGTITEMHIHLWDLCVDYRPLYFPFRAIATLGNLEISTNLTSQASMGCTLRFVAEDSALSLGPQLVVEVGGRGVGGKREEKAAEEVAIFNDRRDLVCVLELGLFEISLRLSERETSLSPKFDLRAAVHDVHIRTCADSARALAEFLGYVAAEGDLNHKGESDTEEEEGNERMDNETTDLLSAESSSRPQQETDLVAAEVTKTKQRHVTNLMEEAMMESRVGGEVVSGDVEYEEEEEEEDEGDEFGDEMFLRTGTEVFFFPDEATKKGGAAAADTMSVSVCVETHEGRLDYANERDETLPQVEEDLGAIPAHLSMRPERRAAQPVVVVATKQPMNSSDADEDYCIIGDEEKVAFAPMHVSEPVHLAEEPIRIVDNHFTMPSHKTDLLQAPQDFPMALVRYTLCEMTITWHMYGGSDFGRAGRHTIPTNTMSTRHTAVEEEAEEVVYLGMSDAYRQGVSYSSGPGAKKGGGGGPVSGSTTWRTCGGPDRRQDVLIEFQLNRVRFSHETYPPTTKHASRQVLLVHEFEIRDKLAVSSINKLLYNNNNSNAFGPLRSPRHMLMIEAVHIRPDNPLPAQECCLRVSLSPLRLNIDQDSLLFLVGFFQEFGGASGDGEGVGVVGGGAGGGGEADVDTLNATERTTLVDPPAPVLMVELPEALQELQARKMVSENLKLLMEEGSGDRQRVGVEEEEEERQQQQQVVMTAATTAAYEVEEGAPVYFRSVRFEPAVQIRIDYQGKRVELSRGPLAGLIMGLGQLQASEFKLKAIKSKQGFLGVDALLHYFIRVWLQDIKKNQLPSILSGVGPMNAFVQLFQGIFDLFWMPIEQYKKDGKLVRGFQRGAKSFSARTALAALEITTRLIYILQLTAETAYDMVSPGPRTLRRGRNRRLTGRRTKKNRVQQPQDIREGVVNAYHIVRDGIGETVQNILEVAALEHDQKGYTGAVGAVVREIPSTMVRPIVLATQATNHVLGGVKNQLVPDARTEMREKWKAEED